MENAESPASEHSTPTSLHEMKESARLPEPTPPLEDVTSVASSCIEQECSHGVLQGARTSSLYVRKDEDCDQPLANGPQGGSRSFQNNLNITPQGSKQQQAVYPNGTVDSKVEGNAIDTVPLLRTPVPNDSEKLTSFVVAASSNDRGQELAVGDMAFHTDAVVRADLRTQEHVEENPCTDPNKTGEVQQKLDTVCGEDPQCDVKAVELGRQRDQAHERAQYLQFLRDKVAELEEENRRLTAVSAEQSHYIEQVLARHGLGPLSDFIRPYIELKTEVEQLRMELRIKEDEVRSLKERLHRFSEPSEEEYLAALDDILKLDAILRGTIQTLESEADVVSGCPALQQLLRKLRCGDDTDEGPTSSK